MGRQGRCDRVSAVEGGRHKGGCGKNSNRECGRSAVHELRLCKVHWTQPQTSACRRPDLSATPTHSLPSSHIPVPCMWGTASEPCAHAGCGPWQHPHRSHLRCPQTSCPGRACRSCGLPGGREQAGAWDGAGRGGWLGKEVKWSTQAGRRTGRLAGAASQAYLARCRPC